MKGLPVIQSVCLSLLLLAVPVGVMAIEVNHWLPPFVYSNTPESVSLTPAQPVTQNWKVCVSYPHLKDAYWLGHNYGLLEEARRLGIELHLVEAGGYPNLSRQRSQILDCTKQPDIDALILGTVSYSGLTDLVVDISQRIPVFATVNDIANEGISAKVGVPWYQMGYLVGQYIRERHQQSNGEVPIAWFPGPKGAGWVPFVDLGFREAIANSNINIVTVGWGDTGKSIQRNLVQNALDEYPMIRYLVGNALMAEAAVSILRERGMQDQVDILSTYFTAAVYRAIKRERILAASNDSPVLQGRLSINQVVNHLEGRPYLKHIGPVINLIEHDNLSKTSLQDSLAPVTYSPLFYYHPKK